MKKFFQEPASEVFEDGASEHGDEKGEPGVVFDGFGGEDDGNHTEAVNGE